MCCVCYVYVCTRATNGNTVRKHGYRQITENIHPTDFFLSFFLLSSFLLSYICQIWTAIYPTNALSCRLYATRIIFNKLDIFCYLFISKHTRDWFSSSAVVKFIPCIATLRIVIIFFIRIMILKSRERRFSLTFKQIYIKLCETIRMIFSALRASIHMRVVCTFRLFRLMRCGKCRNRQIIFAHRERGTIWAIEREGWEVDRYLSPRPEEIRVRRFLCGKHVVLTKVMMVHRIIDLWLH